MARRAPIRSQGGVRCNIAERVICVFSHIPTGPDFMQRHEAENLGRGFSVIQGGFTRLGTSPRLYHPV